MFGGKNIENRSWYTDYRGPLAIHASNNRTGMDDDAAEVKDRGGVEVPDEIDFGAVTGVVDLVHVAPCGLYEPSCDSPWAIKGGFHWVFANPRPCVPVDIKGRLRLWEFPTDKIIFPK